LIYSGNKQNTQNSISNFNKLKFDENSVIKKINQLTNKIVNCNDLYEFEKLIEIHESIISDVIKIDPIQKTNFKDYNNGVVKSLGSWGGDFLLVTAQKSTDLDFFRNRNYKTIYEMSEMVYLN